MKRSLCLLLVLSSGCFQEQGNVKPSAAETREHAVISGERCFGETHPSAGALIVGANEPYIPQTFCTATLIAPDTLLTAAHCLTAIDGDPDAEVSGLGFSFSATIGENASVDAIATSYVIHPDFLNGRWTHDIGLIFLDRALPGPYATVLTPTESDLLKIGADVEFLGYGVSASNGTGGGVRRCGTSWIDAITDYYVGFGHGMPGPGDTTICSGDSGGPAYISVVQNGVTEKRVISAASQAAGECEAGLVTRADAFYTWLDNQMSAACEDDIRVWCATSGILSPEQNGGSSINPTLAPEGINYSEAFEAQVDMLCETLIEDCGLDSMNQDQCFAYNFQEVTWLSRLGCTDAVDAATDYYECINSAGCWSFQIQPRCVTETYAQFKTEAQSCYGQSLASWDLTIYQWIDQDASPPRVIGDAPETLIEAYEPFCEARVECGFYAGNVEDCSAEEASDFYSRGGETDCPAGDAWRGLLLSCLRESRTCADWQSNVGGESCFANYEAGMDEAYLDCAFGVEPSWPGDSSEDDEEPSDTEEDGESNDDPSDMPEEDGDEDELSANDSSDTSTDDSTEDSTESEGTDQDSLDEDEDNPSGCAAAWADGGPIGFGFLILLVRTSRKKSNEPG